MQASSGLHTMQLHLTQKPALKMAQTDGRSVANHTAIHHTHISVTILFSFNTNDRKEQKKLFYFFTESQFRFFYAEACGMFSNHCLVFSQQSYGISLPLFSTTVGKYNNISFFVKCIIHCLAFN